LLLKRSRNFLAAVAVEGPVVKAAAEAAAAVTVADLVAE
jgi:hypothetical protein